MFYGDMISFTINLPFKNMQATLEIFLLIKENVHSRFYEGNSSKEIVAVCKSVYHLIPECICPSLEKHFAYVQMPCTWGLNADIQSRFWSTEQSLLLN